jgi:hypothetical protein
MSEQPHAHTHIDEKTLALRMRLGHLLWRHLRPEDAELTDRDLVLAVQRRWETDRQAPLIDPAE